jgi:hypothetical protein
MLVPVKDEIPLRLLLPDLDPIVNIDRATPVRCPRRLPPRADHARIRDGDGNPLEMPLN